MTIEEAERSSKQFLTAQEAAAFLGINIRTFYELCAEETLPLRTVKMRGKWYIPKRSFLLFVKEE